MGREMGQQFGGALQKMRPSELLPYAEDRTTDPVMRQHVESLAEKIGRQGYRGKQHDAYKPQQSSHIHLAHTDSGSFVMNGNHRVAAMALAGYDKPVPVRVTDLRTKKD